MNQEKQTKQKEYPPCPLCSEPFCYDCKRHLYRCACTPIKKPPTYEN